MPYFYRGNIHIIPNPVIFFTLALASLCTAGFTFQESNQYVILVINKNIRKSPSKICFDPSFAQLSPIYAFIINRISNIFFPLLSRTSILTNRWPSLSVMNNDPVLPHKERMQILNLQVVNPNGLGLDPYVLNRGDAR